MSNKIEIYTDGACSGNPGPGGWGTVVIADGNEIHLSGGEKVTTNNRMELNAVINALQKVQSTESLVNREITLYIDSQYVKNGITDWIINWKRNGWKTAAKKPVKNQELWIQLDALVSSMNIEWLWVKGHSGNKYNEICDQLAVEAGQNASR